MKESNDPDELYEWINSRYEDYSNDEITEDEYLQDLDYYKRRLAELEETPKEETTTQSEENQEMPKRVRSTSIAGLRKKLMEEMDR